MASSRRTGTNENIRTFGTGKTYTSLAAWEADTDNDLVATTTSEVLEVYGDSYSLTGTCSCSGATTNSSYFRIIRPAAGNFLNTGAISTKHFNSSYGSGATITLNESYFQLQDIVFTGTIDSTSLREMVYLQANSLTTMAALVGCVIIDWNNTNTGGATGFTSYFDNTDKKCFFINCIAHNCKTDGFTILSGYASYGYAYNCTSIGNGAYGFNGNSTTYCILKNCGADGNGTADIESGAFSTTTCSETTPTFAGGTDNFHLAAGSDWIDDGTDLSSDTNYAFDDDIDKQTRTGTWDIGADEYVSGAETHLITTISAGTHTHNISSAILWQRSNLDFSSCQHGHSADSLSLSQRTEISSIANATHNHAVETLGLSQSQQLTVSDASHIHNVDSLTLLQKNELSISDISHSHSIEELQLSQLQQIEISSNSHTHVIEEITIIVVTEISGSTCWGHVTGVFETNVRAFASNWLGTGTIDNSGDAERLILVSGEYMESELINTGNLYIELLQNNYAPGSDAILKYRHGATQGDCTAASWNDYIVPFNSLGYVQVRVEA